MANIKTFITLVFLISSISACVSLPKVESPQFEYQGHYLADIDKKKVTVMVELDAYNPNNFGIEGIDFLYQVKLRDKKLASGTVQKLSLQPSQTNQLKVPLVLYYKDLQRGIENVLKSILLDIRTIDVTISMQITNAAVTTDSGWKVSVPIRYKKTIEQDVPLPKREDAAKKLKDEAEKLRNKLKSFF